MLHGSGNHDSGFHVDDNAVTEHNVSAYYDDFLDDFLVNLLADFLSKDMPVTRNRSIEGVLARPWAWPAWLEEVVVCVCSQEVMLAWCGHTVKP